MDRRLARLIFDYQASVRAAVDLIRRSGIPLPATNTDWARTEGPLPKKLDGGVPYFKHGFGCAVRLPTGTVDFDFGPHGEVDGVDPWRLFRFAGSRLPDYGFADEASAKRCFMAEVAAGSLVYSGYILYWTSIEQ